MSPRNFLVRAIEPGLALVPGYMVSDAARVLLMAIAGQESGLSARAQVDGSALGYWQFEQSGLADVRMRAPSVMESVCSTLDIPDSTGIWAALQWNDALACVVARLCLWLDPAPLPVIGDASGAWDYYVRNWRPGKPGTDRWASAYTTAVAAVGAG